MDYAEDFGKALKGLKHCPNCGNELDVHPLKARTMSCYYHGNFTVALIDGEVQIRWRPHEPVV